MYSRLSGSKARQWRRDVAQHARNQSDFVRTLKFPLDTSAIETIGFDPIARLYSCTEGIDKGSLTGLICAVHLSGFRFFGSTREAELFLNSPLLPTEKFKKAWESHAGTGNGNFSPDAVIDLLVKSTRPRAGNLPTYDNKPIAAELYQLATGKRQQPDIESSDGISSILSFFEKQLRAEIPDRAKVADQPELALRLFDSAMATCGLNLPSLKKAYSSLSKLSPSGTTIVFDPSLSTLTLDKLNDTALHAVVAQKLGMLAPGDEESTATIRRQLQVRITTKTNNALSWLFGKGLRYWQENSEKDIMRDYQIPDRFDAIIKELKSWFIAIPKDEVFDNPHYSDFRSSVGGKLDSWIANYFSQLKEIESAVAAVAAGYELPKQLSEPEYAEYLSGTGFTVEQLRQSIAELATQQAKVTQHLDRLLGKADQLPTTEDVDVIERFSQQLSGVAGMLEIVDNRIQQERDGTDKKRTELARNIELKIPDWLKPLPKINRISGGLPDFREELKQDERRLQSLNKAFEGHLNRILSWARDNHKYTEPLTQLSEIEQHLMDSRGGNHNAALSAREQAIRKLLHRLSRLAINGSDKLKSAVKSDFLSLFDDSKDLNRLLYNGQGAVYRSPYSNFRHAAYSLREAELLRLDISALLDRLIGRSGKIFADQRNLTHYRDIVRLKSLRASYLLSGLPDEVPASLLEPETLTEHVTVPMLMSPLLNLSETRRDTLIKCINLYMSEINGVLARLFRESFVLKTKFVRVNKNALSYVPKAKEWKVPVHYWNSGAAIGKALAEFGHDRQDTLDTEPCLSELMQTSVFNKKNRGKHPFAAYLTQAPHDWYVDVDMPSVKPLRQISGLKVDKKKIFSSLGVLKTPCRLVGASSYKTVLDNWLSNPDFALGEYNLMFLHHYRQSVQFDPAGRVGVSCKPEKVTAELALTVTDKRNSDQQSSPISETLIGIDLGEAGIGYAVFTTDAVSGIEEAKPIASGSISVRSVRNLIKRVNYHRKHSQPKQKFQQRYNSALEQLRDNAVGDVAHAIDTLCWKHKGIPILESSVRNLASGAPQLKLIYDRILNLYIFSDIDAHKNVRKHHWHGAELWEHPALDEHKREKQKDGLWVPTGKRKKLSTFPGAAVHPAGTSQVCSECRRNPIQSVEKDLDFPDKKDKKYVIGEGGTVRLHGGETLQLLSRKDSDKSDRENRREEKKYRRQKLTPEYRYPEPPRKIEKDELLKLIKRQLRQPQLSSRSKDTTQSRYICVFDDCRHEMHADENAAINIVKKWVKDKGIVLREQAGPPKR